MVISNCLPKDAHGEYHFKMSSGQRSRFRPLWLQKDRPIINRRLMDKYSCRAVYLDDNVADQHYNGFSNSILWPLFHYHPGEMNFNEENWLAYC
ncbi:hypothetical protein A0H81_10846 [Grifola frondosa]|uniref:Uncharacterized protein n=1 Tax=Grifola frondosa TaxID=5627 RepID=A0A1C7M2G5_GRIFR|nr:hypothetical protein A0H81_10846 [Grifola frondosa]